VDYYDNKSITIEVTNRCSAACIMCPREKMIQNLEVMDFNVWVKLIDNCVELGIEMLDLCGYGDVFLDKGLFDKIAYAKTINPNFKIYISTTGIAMNKKKWEDIVKWVDILKFSIYGMSKEVYEKVMANVKYDRAYKNILGLLELNKKHNNKIYTIGNYIVMEENKHEFDDWINFWEPKLSEVYAWSPHNYVDGRKYRDISGQEQKTCGRPLQGPLNIAVNGEAHVCCFDYNKLLTVGSIKDKTLTEIMNSDRMKEIQEKHRNNDFQDLICSICDQTVKDDSVLLYKTNESRKVGQNNASQWVYED
jgi:MoaA/NifB/PqqE/SkfB family radical SAM enzyme